MSPVVQVFLSTFNGEAFLEEQLQSLAHQEGVRVSVLCRDDGSTDSSKEILESWADKKTDSFELNLQESSENQGVVASFLSLLANAGSDADYFAFCDQDDVWLKQKLAKAVQALEQIQEPALYFTPVQMVTESLELLRISDPPQKLNFASALVEGLAIGCTVVFNRPLLEIYRKSPPQKDVLMHDWWMHLLAQGCGQVVCDQRSYVLYRQHGSNVVGAQSTFLSRYLTKVKRFWNRGTNAAHLSDQAKEFLKCYQAELKPQNRDLLTDFLNSKNNFWSRLKWALTLPTPRQSHLDSLILRTLILFNRY